MEAHAQRITFRVKLGQLLLYLFKVRGHTLKDELRLLCALISYIATYLGGRRDKDSLGYYIPGKEPLKINTMG